MTSPGSSRARPLPPDERRAALIEATVPLLGRCGTRVTTRQIAQAAGVAEGTIFRVFHDKDELVRRAIAVALDPAPALDELDRIDPELALRDRLVGITRVLQRRVLAVINLMMTLRVTAPPEEMGRLRDTAKQGGTEIVERIEELLSREQNQFRRSVREVVRILRLVTLAASHPMMNEGEPLSAEEIAEVVLHGVARPGATSTTHTTKKEPHSC